MEFNIVSQYFQKIDDTGSRLDMTQLLADLLKRADPREAEIICNLSLGQLDPPYIGTKFSIASKNMIKVIAALQGASEKHVKDQLDVLGDLGLVVAQGGWESTGELSVTDVYETLKKIEQMHGTGSSEEKNRALQSLLASLDAVSAKYVVRMVLGKLRLGFSDMTLIDALSWMAIGDKGIKKDIEYAYNKCADIGMIAYILKTEGIDGLRELHVKLGIPIRPAAAERLPTAQAVMEKLGHCVAQPKLDGFRLQVHLDKSGDTPKIWFFSRNLQDMSYMFPDLTAAVAKLPVTNMICEGEAIVYDPNTKNFLPFQETVKRKRKHGIDQAIEDFPLQVYLFDLLYIDDQSLIDESHMMRRETLLTLLDGFNDEKVQAIDERYMTEPQQLLNYFQENISAGLEGLVVKRPDSIYTPGKRNFNWIKLKRQEEGHLDDTIDCVILGYYYGHGKRANFGIGAFLVGVYNKETDQFETIAKVGTGLKDDDWRELKKRCDAIKVDQQPKNVSCAKDLAPDVWVHPELVCMVRADEITLSPIHTANKSDEHLGFALRFPRFMGYRPDKSAKDATDIDEMKHLYDIQLMR
ncbi:MAG: ATP-dependent DNA ligase [Candidatus Dependentiae bacterium]